MNEVPDFAEKLVPTFTKELIGKTLTKVENQNDEKLIITTTEGNTYELYHNQDCCESVFIEDICGDLSDLIGEPLLEVEEVISQDNPTDAKAETIEYQDSFTWTFYKLGTRKGRVTIRWYGGSNGYYSETVDFIQTS